MVALLEPIRPELVVSPAGLLHRLRSAPARTRHRMLVAVESGAVVGWCDSYLRAGESPSGLVWLAVREDRRGRGIGAALFELVADHLRDVGASTLDSYSSTVEGTRFLERHGFAARASAEISRVDPRRVMPDAKADIMSVADVLDRVPELYRLHTSGLGEVFGPELAQQELEEWSVRTLRDPDLSTAGSFVVIEDGRIAALAFLSVAGSRGSNELTATLPELRGRGFARAAKAATLRWATANGIETVYTSNYGDNAAMLAVNRRLGYKRVGTSVDFRAPASV